MKEGWLCPRCKQINSPYIEHCSCKPKNTYNEIDDLTINPSPLTEPATESLSTELNCNHDWLYNGVGEYHCANCGAKGIYIGSEIVPYNPCSGNLYGKLTETSVKSVNKE